MPLEIIVGTIFSIIDLLRMTLILAIPAFIIVYLGSYLHRFLIKRYKLSWAASSFAATYLVVTLLIFLLYVVPYALAFFESPMPGMPTPELWQITIFDIALASLLSVIKIIITGLVCTILVFPLLFLGTFVTDWLQQRYAKLPDYAILFAATYVSSLIALIILLSFPFIFGGLLYFIYFF